MTIEFRGGPRDGLVLELRHPDAAAFYFHTDESQSTAALASHEALIEIRKGFALHRYSFGDVRSEIGVRILRYDGVFPGSRNECARPAHDRRVQGRTS